MIPSVYRQLPAEYGRRTINQAVGINCRTWGGVFTPLVRAAPTTRDLSQLLLRASEV